MGVSTELKEWVNKGLKKGYSKDKLRQELTKAGYSDKDITSALKETGSSPKRNPLVIGIVLIAVIIGSIYLFNALQTKVIVLEAEKDFNLGEWVRVEPEGDYVVINNETEIWSRPFNLKKLSNFREAQKINVRVIAKGGEGEEENLILILEVVNQSHYGNFENSTIYPSIVTVISDVSGNKTIETRFSGKYLNGVMNDKLVQKKGTFDTSNAVFMNSRFQDMVIEGNKTIFYYRKDKWPVLSVVFGEDLNNWKLLEISSTEWQSFLIQFDMNRFSDFENAELIFELSTDTLNPIPTYIDKVYVTLE